MKKTFQERIVELMSEKSITQSEISRITGITQSSLSDYIKGKYQPKQDKIDLIAQALKVSPAYLMGWEEPSEKGFSNSPKSKNDNDEKDIARTMEKLKEQLMNEQGLMFDGELLDEETVKLVLEEVERQERLIKTINKKYIPKKYRK